MYYIYIITVLFARTNNDSDELAVAYIFRSETKPGNIKPNKV